MRHKLVLLVLAGMVAGSAMVWSQEFNMRFRVSGLHQATVDDEDDDPEYAGPGCDAGTGNTYYVAASAAGTGDCSSAENARQIHSVPTGRPDDGSVVITEDMNITGLKQYVNGFAHLIMKPGEALCSDSGVHTLTSTDTNVGAMFRMASDARVLNLKFNLPNAASGEVLGTDSATLTGLEIWNVEFIGRDDKDVDLINIDAADGYIRIGNVTASGGGSLLELRAAAGADLVVDIDDITIDSVSENSGFSHILYTEQFGQPSTVSFSLEDFYINDPHNNRAVDIRTYGSGSRNFLLRNLDIIGPYAQGVFVDAKTPNTTITVDGLTVTGGGNSQPAAEISASDAATTNFNVRLYDVVTDTKHGIKGRTRAADSSFTIVGAQIDGTFRAV